jgi:hypothetical protein
VYIDVQQHCCIAAAMLNTLLAAQAAVAQYCNI